MERGRFLLRIGTMGVIVRALMVLTTTATVVVFMSQVVLLR